MRYYRVEIGDSSNGGSGQTVYTSFPNNQNDPNALNIELDAPVAPSGEPTGDVGAWLRIWGISLKEIAQGSNFNGQAIKVFAGMQKGLPLANPAQAGLIVQGFVFQAFGNWIGTNQTLDFQILPGQGTKSTPKNIIVNWQKGQTMAQALEIALKQAFPNFTRTINIDSKLVLPESAWGVYQTVPQLAQFANPKSKAIIGQDTYLGVNIFIKENAVIVYDGTTQSATTTIAFTDLIGQVTWKAPGLIQVTCVMRAKPGVGDIITLPPGQITINQASLSQFRQGSIFQGNFMISAVRHVGNFRQPAAEAWVTTYDCVPVPNSTGAAA